MYKKIFSLLLICSLLTTGFTFASTAPQPASAQAATATFEDVPATYWAYQWIEALAANSITGGCSTTPKLFCPDTLVTRAQMAVFLLRSKHGNAYTPPAATGTVFTDVPTG